KQTLFEPGENRRVVPKRVEHPPARRLRVRPLVVAQHDFGVIAYLAIPLTLRQQEPGERIGQAAFESGREERLGVTDEADLGPAQARLLPEQAHQAVGVGTGGGVTLPVSDEQKPRLPWGDAVSLQPAQDLAGKTIEKQGMGGIDGIVMDRNHRVSASSRA